MSKGTVPSSYDLSSPFLLAPGGTRIIQVQPTLRCNLRCVHCYSESGPDRTEELSLESLKNFLADAGSLGYQYVGVSGGEPLLWDGLEGFLDFAMEIGFSTSITTNGTLLTAKKAVRLRKRVGIVAVSVDGPPEDHAKIRRSTTAFISMKHGLSALRDAGVPFTLAFTLTRYNADRLRWLYEFANEEGAVGIHVHPLSGIGSAGIFLSAAIPDNVEFKVASWLLALLACNNGSGGPVITFDVIPRTVVEQSCWPMLVEDVERLRSAPFADLVPSLSVEPDGCIVPFTYGFRRKWSLGFIGQKPLDRMAEAWHATCAAPVAAILRSTLERLAAADIEYCDLFWEMLVSANG
ncbi:MAG: hypothetical protein B6D34_05285 [Candidatus Brocadia sp. UTAMX1]|nr:MAG: hypothetical protein B6D34_05285 [Candidatus Brocadia sp. UTAMX1]